MKKLSLFLLAGLLLAMVPMMSSAQGKGGFNAMQSFSTLQGNTRKFMDTVNPWNEKVKANEAMIPAKAKPVYDSFNKTLEAYNGKMGKLAKDPSKFTASDDKSMTGELDKLQSQFKDLQGMTGASVPDMPMKAE